MRYVAGVLALLVLGAVVYLRWFREAAAPPAPPRNPYLEGPWRKTELWDFVLWLPEAWTHKYVPAGGPHGVQFLGPEVDGFRVSILLFWGPEKRSLPQWFRFQRDKRALPGLYRILEEGEDRVAGLPARFLVYETHDRDPKSGQRLRFVTVDWYFVRGGKAGILRGVATGPAFSAGGYRDVFAAVAHRLRLRPPGR